MADRAMQLIEADLEESRTVLDAAAKSQENDYGYDQVFVGRPGDVFVGISTSGRSRNVLEALAAAREIDMMTIGFGRVARCCPSAITYCESRPIGRR